MEHSGRAVQAWMGRTIRTVQRREEAAQRKEGRRGGTCLTAQGHHGQAAIGRRGMQARWAVLPSCRGDGGRFMRDRRAYSPKMDEREEREVAEGMGALSFYRVRCFFQQSRPV
jgi:hypothetical protein